MIESIYNIETVTGTGNWPFLCYQAVSLHDQTVKTKVQISSDWEWKELRLYKKHFLSF